MWPFVISFFETLDDFMEAVTPHLAALRADMTNYTDIEPTFQVSEVLIDRQPRAMDVY
jgi:hypothetical protein